jgi:hypothetical protein
VVFGSAALYHKQDKFKVFYYSGHQHTESIIAIFLDRGFGCNEELREDVDERLGYKANTEVIVGVIAIIINDIMMIANNKDNLFGQWL